MVRQNYILEWETVSEWLFGSICIMIHEQFAHLRQLFNLNFFLGLVLWCYLLLAKNFHIIEISALHVIHLLIFSRAILNIIADSEVNKSITQSYLYVSHYYYYLFINVSNFSCIYHVVSFMQLFFFTNWKKMKLLYFNNSRL